MLEVARALVVDPGVRLVAPVVFLFDGGEETFSQAAHGFMQKYDKPLGVFVNLESTGPGGPDYVFQQTGDSNDEVISVSTAAAQVISTWHMHQSGI